MIDLSDVFKTKNNLKNELFSPYKTLKFIGIDKNALNKPKIYLGSVTSNFYYGQSKNPQTGMKQETVFFVASDNTENIWADSCKDLELVREDGSYVRGKVSNKVKPTYPKLEWQFIININLEDQGALNE